MHQLLSHLVLGLKRVEPAAADTITMQQSSAIKFTLFSLDETVMQAILEIAMSGFPVE